MILESTAIIMVILVMCFMMLRSGRRGYAVVTLPLVIVPATHMSSARIALFLSKLLPYDFVSLRIGVDILALVLSCVIFAILSAGIRHKRTRVIFLLMCGGFSVILTSVLINSIIL